jgi:hypothetical protein
VVIHEEGEKEHSLYQWMSSGGSFGANPLELHFGLKEIAAIKRIEIFWPVTGVTQIVLNPQINQQLTIEENLTR